MPVSAVPKNPRRRRLLALAAFVVFALVLLLVLLTKRDPLPPALKVATQETTAQEHPLTTRLSGDVVDAGSEPDAELDPAKAPPGTVVFRRATLDDYRERHSLPIVSPALSQAKSFRPERSEEAQDPLRHALYALNYEIHKTRLLAIHEDHERERFYRDAERANDTWAPRLRQAAEGHGKLSEKYLREVPVLEKKREDLIQTIDERTKEREEKEATP